MGTKAKSLSDVSDLTNLKKRKLFSDDGIDAEKISPEENKKAKLTAATSAERMTLLSQSSNAKLARFAKSD
uniref:Uncharacterized protein n=1 Tax=Arion vulgaris TaxID=1028688 RepID=A0A0B7AU74_9EUPU